MKKLLLIFLVISQVSFANEKNQLSKIQKKYNLPGVSVLVTNDKEILWHEFVGKRAIESKNKIEANDKFHLGSITKSMTATLFHKLVELKKIDSNDTLEDYFSQKFQVHKDFKNIRLMPFLSNRGGVSGNLIADHPVLWAKFWDLQGKGKVLEQREAGAKEVLSIAPHYKPEEKYLYSNMGFSIAGHAMESKLNTSYEELMEQYFFTPLKMNSCGFGAAGDENKVDQPRGHIFKNDKIVSVPPGLMADNPDGIAPAGKVHCSLPEFAQYVRLHLNGLQKKKGSYLTSETFKNIYNGFTKHEYNMGWIEQKPSWSKGKVLFHNGSNTMNYAEVWISPKDNLGIIVATNIAHSEARAGVKAVIEYTIKKHKLK